MSNKVVALLVTIFGGWFGLHKFLKGKTGLGILYLLTMGLFGIGWLVDIIICINELSKESVKAPVNKNIDAFYIAGIDYCREDLISILSKNNNDYSKFVYRVKEAPVALVPEPTNQHDKNAIMVMMEGKKIGYVPADMTSSVRNMLTTKKFIATISGGDVTDGEYKEKRSFKGIVRIQ